MNTSTDHAVAPADDIIDLGVASKATLGDEGFYQDAGPTRQNPELSKD